MELTSSSERLARCLSFVATPISAIAHQHARFYDVLYPQLRRTYEAAGCPCGTREEDMWRWWQHRVRRERARWQAAERRQRPTERAH